MQIKTVLWSGIVPADGNDAAGAWTETSASHRFSDSSRASLCLPLLRNCGAQTRPQGGPGKLNPRTWLCAI